MFLIEENFDNIQKETSSDQKKLYLSGVFMTSEVRNRNGRTYRRSELTEQVNRVNEAAKAERHILGELDHPPTLTVSLRNVSHKIVEMHMDGNNAIGKAEILTKMPQGQVAAALIESGIIVGMSSRGAGDVNEDTGEVRGFKLITVDIVATPSANAYPKSIYEQLEDYHRGRIVNDLAEAVIHDRSAQRFFAKEIKSFIESLKS